MSLINHDVGGVCDTKSANVGVLVVLYIVGIGLRPFEEEGEGERETEGERKTERREEKEKERK